jgi:MFS family permease
LLSATAGVLYFVPAGVPGLVIARLFLGAGEGMVFTAGSAWVVDLAPPARRGRIIGLYGLSIWSGLSLGPPIGELLLRISSYELVWAFAAGAPLLGAVLATRIHERFQPVPVTGHRPLLAREALGPGAGLSLATVGFATLAAFVVLHLDARGIGHGAAVFTAFAAMVVLARLVGGWLPDRIGGARCAIGAGVVEAAGLALIGIAQSVPVAIAGALAMGAAFSLLYPSLALIVVERVPIERRGAAFGTYTACFDLGVGLGGPIAGVVVALAGYGAAFMVAAGFALGVSITVGLASQKRLGWAPASAG